MNISASGGFKKVTYSTFITGRNEVLAKVIFLHLSVILITGGGFSKFSGGVWNFRGGLQIFGGGGGVWNLGGCLKFSGGVWNF